MIADTSNNKTVAEFFAGIGLMRAGLEDGGWRVTFANDIDPMKQRLYLNHFVGSDDHFLLQDIHKMSSSEIPHVSLATASFPCTDLSLAGSRAGLEGKNSSAFWGFINIIQKLKNQKPPLILIENVAGFLSSNNGDDIQRALVALNNLGYAVDVFIINAAHFVPQSRVRLFIVGKLTFELNENIRHALPPSELRPAKLTNFIYQHPNIHWDINDKLPKLPELQIKLENIIEPMPKNSTLWFCKERVKYLLDQTFERHLIKLNEQKKKTHYKYYTAFRRIRNGKSMAEIRFDGIAGCLRTPKGGSARQILLQVGKGEINIRLLTPRECARLMGADNFKLSGTTNESLFGFGDAVCVPVVSWIAVNYLNPAFSKLTKRKTSPPKLYATAS